MTTNIFKPAAFAGASIAALFALTPVASAHVTPVPSTAPAGGYATIELQIPHGCDGAATERVEVQLNDEISSVKAESFAGWTVSYERAPLDEPIDLHGEQVDEYVSVVSWTAEGDPLPDDEYQRFGISMKVPEHAGDDLLLPTVQYCVGGGTSSWLEADPEAEHPAPMVKLVAADGTDGHDDAPSEDSADSADNAEAESSSDAVARVLGVVAIALAAVGAGLALRKRPA